MTSDSRGGGDSMTSAATHCPTCGREFRRSMGPEELLCILREGTPHREVYRGQNGRWYVTYRRGEVDPAAVRELVRRGAIRPVYSNIPDGAYHIGRTIDMEATERERKAKGDRRLLVYVGGEVP